MKVLQVHTTYREPGGEDSVVRAERALLTAAGHQVVPLEAANPFGARSAAVLAASPWNVAAGRRAARAAAEAGVDVAHVHNTWYALGPAVPVALGRAGVPVVVTLHNYRRVCVNASLFRDDRPCEDCVGRAPWPGVRHRCYRDSLPASAAAATTILLNRRTGLPDRHVGVFLVLNRFMQDVLVRGGLPPQKVQVKGNSVPDPGPRPRPPSQCGSVVVLGRVEHLKGIDLLVDAWDRARPDGLELLVVGDGPLRRPLEDRAVPGVRLLGQLPAQQVRELLLSARAMAFASRLYEGQPMSVLEAMAAGLPVLAPARGDRPELLADAGPGWLVRQDGDWVAALDALAARPAHEVDAAGAALRARWARDHSEAAAVTALEAAYRRAAA